jgi:hypothetical protein
VRTADVPLAELDLAVGARIAQGTSPRYLPGVSGGLTSDDHAGERARRRAAREVIAAYHDEQLRALLERVREGFVRLDAGEIDAFDLDELIHHYKRSARELWKFCGSSGSQWERAASTLAYSREQGDEPDWWQAGVPRRRRG